MNTHAKLTLLFSVTGLVAILGGCGGGGSDSPAPPPATTQGRFIDAAVGNLDYTCGTAPNQTSGKTDSLGVFLYVPGPPAPTCTFSLGGVTLGTAAAGNVLTPYSLVPGSTPGTPNATVTNIARFLQSLDSDGNPANGITIADATRTALAGKTLSFSATDFDTAFATAVAGTSLAGTALVSVGSAVSALDLTLVATSKPAGKDLAKIDIDTLGDRPLWMVEVELTIRSGQEALEDRLNEIVKLAHNS